MAGHTVIAIEIWLVLRTVFDLRVFDLSVCVVILQFADRDAIIN